MRISSPSDLTRLNQSELLELAAEIREFLIEKVIVARAYSRVLIETTFDHELLLAALKYDEASCNHKKLRTHKCPVKI